MDFEWIFGWILDGISMVLDGFWMVNDRFWMDFWMGLHGFRMDFGWVLD